MSRRTPVICILSIALASTAALAQAASDTPLTPAATVDYADGNITLRSELTADPTFVDPTLAYYGCPCYLQFLAEVLGEGGASTQLVAEIPTNQNSVYFPVGSFETNTDIDLTTVVVSSTGAKTAQSLPITVRTPPTAPSGIAGIPGKNRITISWQPSPGATSYTLTLSNGMSFTTTSTSYIVSGLETATSYKALLWAHNSNGTKSAASAPATVKTANIMLRD